MKRFLLSLACSVAGITYGETFFEAPLLEDSGSALPSLTRGDVSPGNSATYTINRSGVYKLTCAQSASGLPVISITANNVTLDLGGNTLTGGTNGIEISGNNVTVKNGLITGALQSGVLVTGDGCRVEKCDFVSCTTGITLQGSHESVVQSCCVRNATQAGISLIQSFTNSLLGCDVLGIQGLSNAYGFIAVNGGANIFDGCSANDIKTTADFILDTAGWSGATVGGFMLKGEVGSKVVGCQGNGANAPLGYMNEAYGVGCFSEEAFLEAGSTFLSTVTESSYLGNTVNSVAWLISGTTKYLASGGALGSNALSIFKFDDATNSLIKVTSEVYLSREITSLAWLVKENRSFLAVLSSSITTNRVILYEFDGNTLITRGSLLLTDGYGNSLAWLTLGDKEYLAIGSDGSSGNNEVGIIDLFADTPSIITQSSYADGAVKSVAWLVSGTTNYLASGGEGTHEISIFKFDDTTNNLISVTHSSSSAGAVNSVAWLVAGGKKYLASGSLSLLNGVSIFEFDDETNSLILRLQAQPSTEADGLLSWLVIGKGIYLISRPLNSPAIVVLSRFDEEENVLIQLEDAIFPLSVNALSWMSFGDNYYLALGGAGDNEVVVAELNGLTNKQSNDCLLVANTLSNVHASQSSLSVTGNTVIGTGLALTTTNHYIAKNTAYDCDISFDGVSTAYITSQANARGVYNIDTALTTPDSIQAMYDLTLPVETKSNTLLSSIVSLQSMIDDNRFACSPTPITTSTTIATPGTYCVAATINGELAITANGVTVYLNGHTLNADGAENALVISGEDVSVSGGIVRGATASGVKITGNSCTLEKISSIGNVTGFELNATDKAALRSCTALDTTREGFLLQGAKNSLLKSCQANNTSGSGLVAGFNITGGTGNRCVDCTVNGVTSSADQAYGILAYDENSSTIMGSSVQDISGVNATAGIALLGDYVSTPTVADFSYNAAYNVVNISWLNAIEGTYLALPDYRTATTHGTVVKFNPIEGLSYVAQGIGFTTYYCSDVSWLSWNNNYYLADCGQDFDGRDIRVYTFDPDAGTLTILSGGYVITTAVFGIDWFMSGTTPYIAAAAYINTTEELVFRFNGTDLTLVASEEIGITRFCVQAFERKGKTLLAFAGDRQSGTNIVMEVYSFNEPEGAENLTLMATYSAGTDLSVQGCVWFEQGDHTFLAVTADGEVKILEYDEEASTTLTQVVSFDPGDPVAVDALTTGTTIFLAVALVGSPAKILKFDPYASTLVEDSALGATSTAALSVKWNRVEGESDKVYLSLGFNSTVVSDPAARVLGFTINAESSELCLVNDNVVSGVSGGPGFLIDPVVNGVVSNSAYNNQNNFMQAVRTSYDAAPFDTSNRTII